MKDAAKPPADAEGPPGRRCTTRGRSWTRTPASRSPGPRWSSAARSSESGRRTGCSRRPATPPAPTARTPSRSPRISMPTPYLYIELDVEHPDYATRDGFGYALSMIRKNEKLNERPFFETDRDAPGPADHRAARDARGRAGGRGAWCWRTRAPTRSGGSSSTAPSPGPRRTPRAGSGCRSPRPARGRTGSCPRIMPPSCTWSPRGSEATWGRSP